jgi:hypothetical protein
MLNSKKGVYNNNESAPLVHEYFQRKQLAELGYKFDGENLSTFQVDCFTIIKNVIDEVEIQQMKKSRK